MFGDIWKIAHYPPAGTVIWVRAYLVFKHRGIVTDSWLGGKPVVITNSPSDGVIEQSWDEFSSGQTPMVEDDFLPTLPVREVIARARSLLGRTYDVLGFNCDHFVNFAHGKPVTSYQLLAAVGIAALALFVAGRR